MSVPNILVVEDKAIIAKDIQITLQDAGYQALATVSSGEAAVRKVAECSPDLILMDIRLKGEMDGVEAAGQIKARYDIPIIFLTAHADKETLDRAVLAEPYGYILKPFEEKELSVAVQVALHKHQAEKEVRNQQRWFSATLESIGDAVLTADPTGRVTYMNPAAQELTSWMGALANGRDIEDVLNFINEESRKPIKNPLVAALQTGVPTGLETPALLTRQDGREIPVGDIATVIRDETGNIIGGVIVLRDMQQTRQLEEQLRQAQKLEAVGQLAAGVAHNFNNILTSISIYTDLVNKTLPLDYPFRSRVRVIQETIERAAGMIDQLLAFTRRQAMSPETLNLNHEIVKTSEMLRHVLPEIIEIEVESLAKEDLIKIDPNQLEQVILNLAINAQEEMSAGGKIRLQTSNNTLTHPLFSFPTSVSPGSYVVLTVTDNGPGISREILDRIFDPFFTTKPIGKGTGLGLATCLGIIEQNRGHITVESSLGQGACFKIYLPLHQQPHSSTTKAPQNASLPVSGGNVLVVEDNLHIREALVFGLQNNGYTVFAAKNGKEALQLIEKQPDLPIRLLITDVVMPEMGGYDLADSLKGTQPNLKVLFISGYNEDGVASRNATFLPKPFTLEMLSQRVTELLER